MNFHILTFLVICTLAAAFEPQYPEACQGRRAPKINSTAPTCTVKHSQGLSQGMRNRWPEGTVPYVISEEFDECQKGLILEGMREISERVGCIKFTPRDDEDDYIYVVDGEDGCFSSLGHVGGKQNVNLHGDGCFRRDDGQGLGTSTPMHELIHALGFTHEHQRTDRDKWISVQKQNMKRTDESQFDIEEGQKLLGAYEYKSIMHYEQYAFSKNKKPTMIAKKRGAKIGAADELTAIDVQKLKKYYGCQ